MLKIEWRELIKNVIENEKNKNKHHVFERHEIEDLAQNALYDVYEEAYWKIRNKNAMIVFDDEIKELNAIYDDLIDEAIEKYNDVKSV